MAIRISGFTTIRPNMAGTRTYQDFSKFLGARPERLGIVSRLYEDYTATALTEALMNTVTLEKGKKGPKSINSFLVEWDLSVNKIERIPLVQAVAAGEGVNASEIQFHFAKNYFQPNDVFIMDKTRQQFFVCAKPQRCADNDWLVIAKIQDNDYNSTTAAMAVGDTARFMSNIFPELHEYGQHFLVAYRY